ncbi:MAG: hypothetical protein HW388_1083 [Dehalococcoidia bacterium]|nr:hypothetical protein [Dehalococcoidia bacterium]
MPKQSPVPDKLSKPFWDACNEGKLVMLTCTACNLMQYPPEATCRKCNSAEKLVWKEVSGWGKIHGYCTMYDCRIRLLQAEQPFNLASIALEEDPGVLMYANLPGTPVDEVPVGATVKVEFVTTPGNGQKVPEWRVTEPRWKAAKKAARPAARKR